jgi:hypothetical protein
MDILFANDPVGKKAWRFIVQLLADFLPDAPPVGRRFFHRLGFNHSFPHRQVFGRRFPAPAAFSSSINFSTKLKTNGSAIIFISRQGCRACGANFAEGTLAELI